MFKISFMFLFIAYSLVNIAQTNLNVEIERLEQNPDLKVEYLDNDRIQVNYGDFGKRIFYVGKNNNGVTLNKDIPRFVFNVEEIDTSHFAYKFNFWQEVPISSDFLNIVVGDINNNNKFELYGSTKDFNKNWSEVFCYEQNANGIFTEKYKYPNNTVFPLNIFDINNDNKKEVHILCTFYDSIWGGSVHNQTFFTQVNEDSLANQYFFDYNIYKGAGLYNQLNDFTIGDYDNDSINEAIFYNFMPPEIWITKFNPLHLSFDSILAYPTKYIPDFGNESIQGFVIDDFDHDSYTDIIYSSLFGNIYVVENGKTKNYPIVWEGNSGTPNSYLNFKSNDINTNGKKEFWIGGESFSENLTRLVCYEMVGDNNYLPCYIIELLGLPSLEKLTGGAIDVDNDKVEELYISSGNKFLIIKFFASNGNPFFQIDYFKKYNFNLNYGKLQNFSNNDYPKLMLSGYKSQNGETRHFTQIYNYYIPTAVHNKQSKNNELTFINYPNPYNSYTKVKFYLSYYEKVKLNVYNILGEEISILLDQTLEKGEHTVTWNGKDKNNNDVPSGIYFISLETNSFHKIIKTTLLK